MIYLSIQTTAENIILQAKENPAFYVSILLALFEIFVRLRPTQKNLSILAKLTTLLNFIFPNKSKDTRGNKLNNFKF